MAGSRRERKGSFVEAAFLPLLNVREVREKAVPSEWSTFSANENAA
jgi:hypothetical protein